MTTMMAVQSVSLRDFLLEAELQQYHSAFTKDLKVTTVQQLKYVDDEDLMLIGMTKPEMRRLKKFFQKEYPQGTLGRFRKKIMKGSSFDERRASSLPPPLVDKQVANSPSKAANRHIIPSDSITVCKELGVGEFGVVQQGIWTNEDGDRIQVAIKCLSKEHMLNNPMDFLKEACIMHTIDNRHIVRLYGVVLNTRALMLVTELAPLRSLLECLKEPTLRSSFPVAILCEFALQITNGMHYLEDNRLIHRDLAARNVLVFSKNCVKISDFGLSRALGVGKDYYQTNFNVNLKLPIAWCAPECINYLRFTSASDVWALGVTLWEMFSYGFQPWAALTGQQILEAIDEPSYQRLEKPECCPADYYRLMASCWEHEPPKRPTFAELHRVIPNIKPDQVQVIQDSTGTMKKEHLDVKQGDIVTVLDKKPPDAPPNLWKGVLNNGKTGLFKPLHTVPYMGANSKQTKQKPKTLPKPLSLGAVGGGGAAESDGDARHSRPAHRGKLTQDMISPPQGDLRHTLHVGRSEGDVFGDVSFLRGKYAQLPKQRVSPYKPSDDRQAPLRAETPSVGEASDLAPLLCDTASVSSLRYDAKAAPARRNEFNNEGFESASLCADYNQDVAREVEAAAEAEEDGEHSYTEISDESESSSPYNIQPDAFQFENSSFMDEVFKALDESAESLCGDDVTSDPREVNLGHELAGEVDQLARDLERRGGGGRKKQQALVKPISSHDQKRLDTAIAIVTDYAQKTIDGDDDDDGSPSSWRRRGFMRLRASPRAERRNFSREIASIRPDISRDVLNINADAKLAYGLLVDREARCTPSPPPPPPNLNASPAATSTPGPKPRGGGAASPEGAPPARPTSEKPVVRPRYQNANVRGDDAAAVAPGYQAGPLAAVPENEGAGNASLPGNVLPLPPRKKGTSSLNLKRHQRRYPLLHASMSTPDIPPKALPRQSPRVRSASLGDVLNDGQGAPLPQSAKSYSAEELGIYDNQDYFWSDKLELSVDEEANIYAALGGDAALGRARYKCGEHVSYEDLLEFALDDPTSAARRAQAKSQGVDSDEVRIMQKVLSHEMSLEDCTRALNETGWNVHHAIKYVKLQQLLLAQLGDVNLCKKMLLASNWDVEKAANCLLGVAERVDDDDDVSE